MTVTAIIQARLGSTRLPGKTLIELEGVPLLGHLISRVRACRNVDGIVIATTVKQRDDRLEEYAKGLGIGCFRGDEDDVLDRFYGAAKEFGIATIVRVTPDCPMLDPDIVDMVVEEFLKSGADYATNTLPPTYPDGMDVEVLSFSALETAWKESSLRSEREHVTPYIRNHPEHFTLVNVAGKEDLSRLRLTVDEQLDLDMAKEIFRRLYPGNRLFGLAEVLALLECEPGLLEINQMIGRNEGYAKSLKEDAAL
ncbi:MAG: glycosyltransferase family protein [Nitrospirae bacterium]|nr:glycosyltransferase family protein [Nitrospirota bacterium]